MVAAQELSPLQRGPGSFELTYPPERRVVDINKSGTLVHGVEYTNQERLKKIFAEGLIPLNQQDEISPFEFRSNKAPDYVSLSMVGSRYTSTFAEKWGAADWKKHLKVTLVIDPEYVRANVGHFIAVGRALNPESDTRLIKELPYGMQYMETSPDIAYDEVWTEYVSPWAIIGIIVKRDFRNDLKKMLKQVPFLRKPVLYDVGGNIIRY